MNLYVPLRVGDCLCHVFDSAHANSTIGLDVESLLDSLTVCAADF